MSDYEEYAKSLSFELDDIKNKLKHCEDDRYIEEQEKLRLEKENAELRTKLEELDLEKLFKETAEIKFMKEKNLLVSMEINYNYSEELWSVFANSLVPINGVEVRDRTLLEAIKTFRQKLEEMK